jgi:hypothetical protein
MYSVQGLAMYNICNDECLEIAQHHLMLTKN